MFYNDYSNLGWQQNSFRLGFNLLTLPIQPSFLLFLRSFMTHTYYFWEIPLALSSRKVMRLM
ncbi:hypothetical protein Hdeb2414_s0004g00119701 [Helianthus debilis subsp. tardiflorus]